ncbi:hypothetical protein [Actinoplanes awajinensis]|uniref:DUF1648 domain-containing protein n=1 Tax=Actinoplanes awajinensis subsp. mycoplanecinus TaxID=135947 RepID=A0A101J8Z4_9ACTN|nr:hypothetical protein [Actinoplanes awajinensis]KUL22341.1 hypothetical protein ADL15_48260 [Actinoplanes awajinensis subsp. mycoplanecinus]
MMTRIVPTLDDRSWQPRARRVVLWSSVFALVAVAVALAVVWSWRDTLPDPLASHWGPGADAPDGFTSLPGLVFPTVALVILGCAAFGAIGLLRGAAAVTRRMVAGSSVWLGGFTASLLLFVTGTQRDLADPSQARLSGWALAAVIVLPLVPAAVAALLAGGDRPAPATTPVAADAARIALTDGERAVWIRRANGGPGLIVGAVVAVATVVLAVVLREWALLTVPVLLAALFAVMFAYTVRVDATGLTVRSLLGRPGTHIPADEVERASVVQVEPLREFGGWGWRVGRGGRVGVVLRSGAGLLVERTGGRSFVVTVDDAATGAALLNTLADRSRR